MSDIAFTNDNKFLLVHDENYYHEITIFIHRLNDFDSSKVYETLSITGDF